VVHKQGREIGHTTMYVPLAVTKREHGSKEPVLIMIIQAGPEGQ
jgi:hypothetical protein